MDKQLNCGAFKSKVLSVSISLVAWAAYPQCSTTLNVDCVLEWYYYASDALSSQTSLPVSSLVLPEVTLGTELFDAWHTRCITMNFIGMDFHFSSNDIGASFNVQSAQKLDLELGLDFFKNTLLNGQEAHLTPTFTHCGDVPWITDHLGGTNNLYVFHAGTGPYPKKKAHAKYHTCRDIIVENGSTEPIEIPITIQGSVWASVQTFANNTYARS